MLPILERCVIIVPPHASANLASFSQHALVIWFLDSTSVDGYPGARRPGCHFDGAGNLALFGDASNLSDMCGNC
jgi:hypothetical protein